MAKLSANEANSAFHPSGVDNLSSNLCKKWVTEANGRWRGERRTLPPTSLSVPSYKAGVYARCRLKTIETGGECKTPRAVGRGRPISLGITLFFFALHQACIENVIPDRYLLAVVPARVSDLAGAIGL